MNSKPGYKTTEFYLSLAAALLGALLTSGLLSDGSVWAQIIGGALALLASMGYGQSRAKVKAVEQAAAALVASAEVSRGEVPGPTKRSRSSK